MRNGHKMHTPRVCRGLPERSVKSPITRARTLRMHPATSKASIHTLPIVCRHPGMIEAQRTLGTAVQQPEVPVTALTHTTNPLGLAQRHKAAEAACGHCKLMQRAHHSCKRHATLRAARASGTCCMSHASAMRLSMRRAWSWSASASSPPCFSPASHSPRIAMQPTPSTRAQ